MRTSRYFVGIRRPLLLIVLAFTLPLQAEAQSSRLADQTHRYSSYRVNLHPTPFSLTAQSIELDHTSTQRANALVISMMQLIGLGYLNMADPGLDCAAEFNKTTRVIFENVVAELKAHRQPYIRFHHLVINNSSADVVAQTLNVGFTRSPDNRTLAISLQLKASLDFSGAKNPIALDMWASTPLAPLASALDAMKRSSSAAMMPPIMLTLTTLHVAFGGGLFDARGVARLPRDVAQASFTLHATMTNLNALPKLMQTLHASNAQSALLVALLAGRRHHQSMTWKITMENGLISINGLPIPMRL